MSYLDHLFGSESDDIDYAKYRQLKDIAKNLKDLNKILKKKNKDSIKNKVKEEYSKNKF